MSHHLYNIICISIFKYVILFDESSVGHAVVNAVAAKTDHGLTIYVSIKMEHGLNFYGLVIPNNRLLILIFLFDLIQEK